MEARGAGVLGDTRRRSVQDTRIHDVSSLTPPSPELGVLRVPAELAVIRLFKRSADDGAHRPERLQ